MVNWDKSFFKSVQRTLVWVLALISQAVLLSNADSIFSCILRSWSYRIHTKLYKLKWNLLDNNVRQYKKKISKDLCWNSFKII